MSYWLFAIPGLLLAVLASLLTQSTFRRYSRVRAMSGLTGAEAAEQMRQARGALLSYGAARRRNRQTIPLANPYLERTK